MRTNFKILLTSLVFTTTGVALWYVTSKLYQPSSNLKPISTHNLASIPTTSVQPPALVQGNKTLTPSPTVNRVTDSEAPLAAPPTQNQTVTASSPDATPSAARQAEQLAPQQPTLSHSDEHFVAQLAQASVRLAAWLTPTQQIRKWVAAIDVLAQGNVPMQDLPFEYSVEPFVATAGADEQQFTLAASNYQRGAELVNTLTLIPAEQLVATYRSFQPLFEQAYNELGNEDFDLCITQAITNILAVEALLQPVQLKQPVVFYTYAKPELEQASRLEKFIWRLGPTNSQALQSYLTEVKSLLER